MHVISEQFWRSSTVQKRFWFTLSNLILIFLFNSLILGKKEKNILFSLEHRAVAASVHTGDQEPEICTATYSLTLN